MLHSTYQRGNSHGDFHGPYTPLVSSKDGRSFVNKAIMGATGFGIVLFVVLVTSGGSSDASAPQMRAVVGDSQTTATDTPPVATPAASTADNTTVHTAPTDSSSAEGPGLSLESCMHSKCVGSFVAIGMNWQNSASGKLLNCLGSVDGKIAKAKLCIKEAGAAASSLDLCAQCSKCLPGTPSKKVCAKFATSPQAHMFAQAGNQGGNSYWPGAGGQGGQGGQGGSNPYWPPQAQGGNKGKKHKHGSTSAGSNPYWPPSKGGVQNPYWPPQQGQGGAYANPWWPQGGSANSQVFVEAVKGGNAGSNPYWPGQGGANPYWPQGGQGGSNPYWPGQGGQGGGSNPYWPGQGGQGGGGSNPYWPPQQSKQSKEHTEHKEEEPKTDEKEVKGEEDNGDAKKPEEKSEGHKNKEVKGDAKEHKKDAKGESNGKESSKSK